MESTKVLTEIPLKIKKLEKSEEFKARFAFASRKDESKAIVISLNLVEFMEMGL